MNEDLDKLKDIIIPNTKKNRDILKIGSVAEERDPDDCHRDYWGWNGELKNGFGDFVKKACPREMEDHCIIHCPENPDHTVRCEDPVYIEDDEIMEWNLECHYCAKDLGEERRKVTIGDVVE